MARDNKYKYTHCIINNKPARYIQVLSYIDAKHEARKRNICIDIFKYNEKWGAIRGYQSHLFACMRSDDLIRYDSETATWRLGNRGYRILTAFRYVYGGDFPTI